MGEFLRSVFSTFGSLMPPAPGDNAADIRWKRSVSIVVITLLVVSVINVAIAYGFLPPWWYATEAQVSQLQGETNTLDGKLSGIATDVDMNLKLDLGKQLRDDQLNRCNATDGQLKQNLSSTIDTEEQYYYKRFGMYYQLPSCDQL